jgi:hypothetical protein
VLATYAVEQHAEVVVPEALDGLRLTQNGDGVGRQRKTIVATRLGRVPGRHEADDGQLSAVVKTANAQLHVDREGAEQSGGVHQLFIYSARTRSAEIEGLTEEKSLNPRIMHIMIPFVVWRMNSFA